MSDSKQTALTPAPAQQAITTLANALRSLDRQLERLTQDLDTSGDALLPKEIVGTVGAVRRDLLVDAIETLDQLATKTEDDVDADQARVIYLVETAR